MSRRIFLKAVRGGKKEDEMCEALKSDSGR